MKIIELEKETNIFTETFKHLADVYGANDKTAAKKFGEENWTELDIEGKKLYRWLFPLHNPALGACRYKNENYEKKILKRDEAN